MPDTQLAGFPPECADVALRLWDYLDGQLTDDASTTLRAHIAMCPQCYEYQLFQERYFEALASLRTDLREGPCGPAGVRRRVLASLAAAGFAAR